MLDTQYCHVAGGKLTIFTDIAAQHRELRLARHVAVGVGQAHSTMSVLFCSAAQLPIGPLQASMASKEH